MIGFYVLAVVGFYFSVGLAAAADMIFRGQEASRRRRPRRRPQRFCQIAAGRRSRPRSAWSSALLENQGGIGGQIAGRLLGMGWSLITFLAVPVIAIEGTGPVETLKRSAPLQAALGTAGDRQHRDRRRQSS